MAIRLKSRDEIDAMRQAGRLVHKALVRCREACKPGVTTEEINAEAEKVLAERPEAVGLFQWYPTYRQGEGFPAVTCISINQEVVHGIPGPRKIVEGDLVSIDFGVRIDGWCGDAATTIMVGNVAADHRRLCEVTEHVLEIAMQNICPGRRWSQIARQMQTYAEQAGVGIVKDFVGHGIGKTMHEDPKVPNFVSRDLMRNDIVLQSGMVIAVEPMCCLGSGQVKVLDDGWTVVACDGKPAAHYEHTIAVTEHGCEALTNGQ